MLGSVSVHLCISEFLKLTWLWKFYSPLPSHNAIILQDWYFPEHIWGNTAISHSNQRLTPCAWFTGPPLLHVCLFLCRQIFILSPWLGHPFSPHPLLTLSLSARQILIFSESPCSLGCHFLTLIILSIGFHLFIVLEKSVKSLSPADDPSFVCLLLSIVLYQFLKGVGMVVPEGSGPCDQITIFNLKHTQYSLK